MEIQKLYKLKFFLITIVIFSFYCSLYAQTSEKLPATYIIGTELSVDYATNEPSTTVNIKSNVFDGNINTYFASYERSGTWVGLDLRERHVITKIAFAPRRNIIEGPKRLLLGIIEGANNSDFSDAIPLFMITELPAIDMLTEQEINCSKGFRYVRYVGPNDARCNIAELEFYGYKGAGNNSNFYQLTNLPTLTISTKDAAEIVSRDDYLPGFISIIDNGTFYSDILEIRGRGHASWTFPKKPYRLKLRNKVNLLGLPAKERSWTLINHYGDKTLMRNLIAFDLSKCMEMSYTPAGVPVDVILNGEYKGTYTLCDQIEVADGRVEIQQMSARDIVLPNLSGGYLLEIDGYAELEDDGWFYSAIRSTPVKIRSPKGDEIVSQQYYYIRDHYNKMEQVLFSLNYLHLLDGYRKYIDTESFMRFFLIGELTGNTDTFWSTYMYKDRNTDIFKFGPVWDFELAYENDSRTYPVNSHTQWIYNYGSSANGFIHVVNRFFSDSSFVSDLKTMYIDYRERDIISENALFQVIDDYAMQLDQSQQCNFIRWDILSKKVHLNPQIFGSYEEEVENVKNYISERIDWMDKKFDYSPTGNLFKNSNLSNIMVNSQVNVIYIHNLIEPVLLNLFDITGKIVFSKTINSNTQIPVSKGLYFIQLDDLKGNRKTMKCLVTD